MCVNVLTKAPKIPAHVSAFRSSADVLCVPTGNPCTIFYERFRHCSHMRRAGIRCEAVCPRSHSVCRVIAALPRLMCGSAHGPSMAALSQASPLVVGEKAGSVVRPASQC